MRIISGKYKGRVIRMPKGSRPTQGKVRKALFDILGDIKGLSFLELFAGSGAVGLEAISQGAKGVVFVEREKRCCKIIQQNLRYVSQLASEPVSEFNRQTGKWFGKLTIPRTRSTGSRLLRRTALSLSKGIPSEVEGQANRQTILNMDSMEAIILLFHKKQKFDIIFLDPPYYEGLAKKTLQRLSCYDILAPNGFIVVQHFKKDNLPDRQGDLVLFKQSRYGDTLLSFYRHI